MNNDHPTSAFSQQVPDSERAKQVKALFEAALDLPEAERESLLTTASSGQPEVSARVRQLLQIDAQLAGSTVQPAAADMAATLLKLVPGVALAGMRVGPYELREELGLGGMGLVHRAERVDGKVQQQVAIKFVRRELLDEDSKRRFQQERRTLATLDHPNIARLLDAAELEDGSPYLVMEYVAGTPITEHCERNGLDLRARLHLFREVCSAVSHAHRQLIVHRDLKPGNLLVTAEGMPKLLDFGIAKTLVPTEVGLAQQTGTAQRYFSPRYAAPEQMLGASAGVACDVYALGLLLYELLADAPPFDFTGLSAGQIERLVTTVPPAAPSLSASRNAAAPSVVRMLRGDLDGIVLRCLRKAPAERYVSVEQLDLDLDNYLAGRPVMARSGQRWYRTQKFLQRNRLAVAGGTLLGLALVTGLIAFAWQARIARQRAAELELVANFQAEMLSQVNPSEAGILLSRNIKGKLQAALAKASVPEDQQEARIEAFEQEWALVNATDLTRDLIDQTILKPAITTIDRQFDQQPLVDARLRQVLADRYLQIGLYEAAIPLQARALEIRTLHLGPENRLTLESLYSTGDLFYNRRLFGEAEQHWRRLHETCNRVFGERDLCTLKALNGLGVANSGLGKFAQAEEFLEQALAGRRVVLGPDHPDTLTSTSNLILALSALGRHDKTESLAREVLAARRRVLGEEHPDTLSSINNLAVILQGKREYAEALGLLQEALEKRRRILGEEHDDTLTSLANYANVLDLNDQPDKAEHFHREGLAIARRTLGGDHRLTITFTEGLGSALQYQNRLDEAEPFWAQALAARIRLQGLDHIQTLRTMSGLGTLLQRQGRLIDAEAHLRTALEKYVAVFGILHPEAVSARTRLGGCLVAQEQFNEAEKLLSPHLEGLQSVFNGANTRHSARFMVVLGKARIGMREFETAEKPLLDACEIFEKINLPNSDLLDCAQTMTRLYEEWQSSENGMKLQLQAAEWRIKASKLAASQP